MQDFPLDPRRGVMAGGGFQLAGGGDLRGSASEQQQRQEMRGSVGVAAPESIPSFSLGVDEEEEDVSGLAGASDEQDDPDDDFELHCGLRPLDPNMQAMIDAECSSEKTMEKNAWALRRFNRWRKATIKNQYSTMAFQDLPLQVVGEMLTTFLQQVTRNDGKPLSASSLNSLMVSFQRILRAEQDKRIQRTGVNEEKFNIEDHAFFRTTKAAWTVVIKQVSKDRRQKENSVITWNQILEALKGRDFDKRSSKGLQNRLLVYLMSVLFVRTQNEVHDLLKASFEFTEDENGQKIKFKQGVTKNHKPSIKNPDDYRPVVELYKKDFPDLYDTVREYYSRLPADDTTGYLLLAAIHSPGSSVWYCRKSRLGVHGIKKVAALVAAGCGLSESKVTNKALRHAAVTALRERGVSIDDAMKMTGHKQRSSFEKYDNSCSKKSRAALKSLCTGEKFQEAYSSIETGPSTTSFNPARASSPSWPAQVPSQASAPSWPVQVPSQVSAPSWPAQASAPPWPAQVPSQASAPSWPAQPLAPTVWRAQPPVSGFWPAQPLAPPAMWPAQPLAPPAMWPAQPPVSGLWPAQPPISGLWPAQPQPAPLPAPPAPPPTLLPDQPPPPTLLPDQPPPPTLWPNQAVGTPIQPSFTAPTWGVGLGGTTTGWGVPSSLNQVSYHHQWYNNFYWR